MDDVMGYAGELTCVLQVGDLDRSIGWYGEAMGFPLLFRVDEIGWCELETNIEGVTIGLSQVEQVAVGGGAVLTFSVEDAAAARSRLEELGTAFDGEIQEIPGLVRLCTFFDPDGNTLMLSESLR